MSIRDDLTEFLHERHRSFDVFDQEGAKNLLVTICAQLRECGVTEAVVSYSGSCDEGAVEDIDFTPEGIEVPDEVRGLVEDWVDAVLPLGYEINEGSQGSVTIDVGSSRALFEHERNAMETVSDSWEIG